MILIWTGSACFHWDEAIFFFFFFEKKSKWPTQKNSFFQLPQLPQFSLFFYENFMEISRIDWCEGHWCDFNLYGHEAVQHKLKNSLKTQKMHFLPIFELMSEPFASINSIYPRNNPWNFHEKILRIGGAGKWDFFESAILNSKKKIIIIRFISMKTSNPFIWGIIYFCTMDGFFRILENISSEIICTQLWGVSSVPLQVGFH
jgi:hypothetical protein